MGLARVVYCSLHISRYLGKERTAERYADPDADEDQKRIDVLRLWL